MNRNDPEVIIKIDILMTFFFWKGLIPTGKKSVCPLWYLFYTVQVRKGLFEIIEVLPHAKDPVRKPLLSWDDSNIGNVLSPHEIRLTDTVELWKKEGTDLLLLYIVVLLTVRNTISCTRLRLGGCSVLAIIVD
jgi:hypothetical protein